MFSFVRSTINAHTTRAYFDSQGVTTRFNMNLLARMNRELGANFQFEHWMHRAIYNANISAMESWLIPTSEQRVQFGPLCHNMIVNFHAYGGIRVERSHKYTLKDIDDISCGAGFSIVRKFVDDNSQYCVALLRKKPLAGSAAGANLGPRKMSSSTFAVVSQQIDEEK